MNKLLITTALTTLVAGSIFILPSPTNGASTDVCPGGDNSWSSDWYKKQGSPYSLTVPSGYTIDQVCVKGGTLGNNNAYLFTTTNNGIGHTCDYFQGQNHKVGSISVSGIGTQTANATSAGNGCADISHASFHRVIAVTPTDTPTPTPTNTPTPTVTVTPTDTPTPTPTGSSNQTTTTVTPSVSPTTTPTDTPTLTPTSGASNSTNSTATSGISTSSEPTKTVESIQVSLSDTKMAETGTFVPTAMNLMALLGSLLTGVGLGLKKKQK